MNDQAFAEELAQLLEISVDLLHVDVPLGQFENWDSLTQISVLALVRERYRRILNNDVFDKITTYGELLASINDAHVAG
ncbi:hypothetical protein [Pseudomonas sp. NPDC089547]|uniref:hypothetical protein n=1 Tax=Pseudomonas sp. NPDC089547 TaxID=3390652 RepID=UPI003D009B8F